MTLNAVLEKQMEPSLHPDEKVTEFNNIIRAITSSKGEDAIYKNMGKLHDYKYFMWGFGASHMWVHEIDETINKTRTVRLLILCYTYISSKHPLHLYTCHLNGGVLFINVDVAQKYQKKFTIIIIMVLVFQ